MVTQYGTAVRRKDSGKLLDTELADSLESAQRQVILANNNIGEHVGVEWVVVEISLF